MKTIVQQIDDIALAHPDWLAKFLQVLGTRIEA